jgi:L-ascorbate metabolism protein UlaG (beta-lactamase superfamily)
MTNPDYAIGRFKDRITIEYVGLSCFIVTSSKNKRIIMDPFIADRKILYPELKKEIADVVTVSCGSYAHCHVFAVGGVPFIYQVSEPTELHGIKFRGVETQHLKMLDAAVVDPAKNVVMCFEVDGIKLCHLGALGHKLTDEQVQQIGQVDILMVPVGGVSTLPVDDARAVCKQINPQIILPMHYRNERALFPDWATVYDFLGDRKMHTRESDGMTKKYYENTLLCDYVVGSNILEFAKKNGRVELTCPGDKTQIAAASMNVIVPRCAY